MPSIWPLPLTATGHPFDLVLMDLEMPLVDGYEATRRIREGGFPGPILALSGHSTDDYRQDSLKMGCNDCLRKPIDWNQLAALVRKYLPDHALPDLPMPPKDDELCRPHRDRPHRLPRSLRGSDLSSRARLLARWPRGLREELPTDPVTSTNW